MGYARATDSNLCRVYILCAMTLGPSFRVSHVFSCLLSTDRKLGYKRSVDLDAGRRRREETRLQIRKSKKDEQIAKRRAGAKDNLNGDSKQPQDDKRLPTLADIPTLKIMMQRPSSSPSDRVNAVRGIRRMLSVEQNPPAKHLIESGVLAALVPFLWRDDEPMLQYEAAWALTNVASTEFTEDVVNAGATPGLVRLLECTTPDVREQAGWCLGNIAGDSPTLRDYVLELKALPSL